MTARAPSGGQSGDPALRLANLERALAGLYGAIGQCGIAGIRDTSHDMADSQLSGVAEFVRPPPTAVGSIRGAAQPVLRARCPGRSLGWASVHVFEQNTIDASNEYSLTGGPGAPGVLASHTQKLELIVNWRTKRGGGQCRMDATRGTLFSIPALESIDIEAQIVRANSFNEFTAGPTKRVEACVHWGTSISPKAVFLTSESQSLAAGVDGAAIAIPECARSFIAMSVTPATLGNLTAHMQTGTAGGRTFATLNPNANGTPVAHGAEFLVLNSTTDAIITVVWELWL